MSAQYYQPVYLLIVTVLTYFVCRWYNEKVIGDIGRTKASHSLLALLLATFLILFIGFRPLSGMYFVDMAGYNLNYMVFYYGNPFFFTWDTENYLFDNILPWFGANLISIDWFFLLIAFIYFGLMLWACWKIFPKDTLLAFLVYLGAFSTFSYGTNGIKAGAAASIFLLALAYRKNKILAVVLLWISLGFHHSMLAPIAAYIVASFYRKPKYYLWGWLLCLLLAAGHVTFFMGLFSGFTDEHGANYLSTEVEDAVRNVSGFRPDFILYSAVPIFFGYWLMVKKGIESETYNFLWCTYTLTNCMFLLCTYGSFINRIAYLSWLMLPIVLLYPFVNISWGKGQQRYLHYVVYGHLFFTLFMQFVYYA